MNILDDIGVSTLSVIIVSYSFNRLFILKLVYIFNPKYNMLLIVV